MRRKSTGRLASPRYDDLLKRGAAINCGLGVAIALMGAVSEGISIVGLAAFGLVAAMCVLRVVDACADVEAVIAGNGGRDRD